MDYRVSQCLNLLFLKLSINQLHKTKFQSHVSLQQKNQLLLPLRSQLMINTYRHHSFKIMVMKRFLEQHPGIQLQSLPLQRMPRFQQVSLQRPHRGSRNHEAKAGMHSSWVQLLSADKSDVGRILRMTVGITQRRAPRAAGG